MTTNENIMNTEPVKIKENKVAKTVRGRLCKSISNAISSTAFRIYPTDTQEKDMISILKCLKRIEYDYLDSRFYECVDLPSEYLRLHIHDLKREYGKLVNSPYAVSIYTALNRIYHMRIPRENSREKLFKCNAAAKRDITQPALWFVIRIRPLKADLEWFNCLTRDKLQYPSEYELSQNLSVEYNNILQCHENILCVPGLGYIVSDRKFIDKNLYRCVDIIIRRKEVPFKDGHYEWYMDLCTEYQVSCTSKYINDYGKHLDLPRYANDELLSIDNIPNTSSSVKLHLIPRDTQVNKFEYYIKALNYIGHDFLSHAIKDISNYGVSNYMNFIYSVFQRGEIDSLSVKSNGIVTEFYSESMVRYILYHRMPEHMILCYLNSVYKKMLRRVYGYISYTKFLNDMEEYIIDEITEVDSIEFPVYLRKTPIKHRMKSFDLYKSDIYLATSKDIVKSSYQKYFKASEMRRVIRLTDHIGYIKFKKGNNYSISQKDFLNATRVCITKQKNRWYLILYTE